MYLKVVTVPTYLPTYTHTHTHTHTHEVFPPTKVPVPSPPLFSILLETERGAEMHQNKPPLSFTLDLTRVLHASARCGTGTI